MDAQMQGKLKQIEKLLNDATSGPWKVYEKTHEEDKPFLAERLIGTAWDHPQLKGPAQVVTWSYCLYEPHFRVFISKEDAEFIANAPQNIATLLQLVREQETKLAKYERVVEVAKNLIQKARDVKNATGDNGQPDWYEYSASDFDALMNAVDELGESK